MKYETVIGLEVHCQLKTETKIFCACSTSFGKNPNQNTCPICLGMPGVLPVLNKKALDLAISASLAANCKVQPLNRFARKNYFYPDLPKGYQISQFELPLAQGGYIDIQVDGLKKRIGLTRIHMEEDAGKLVHGENIGHPGQSYVDFNRAGIPLIEIVSEPDLRSSAEAREYLLQLKSILEYAEVSDCNMEEGSLRCDANISLRPFTQQELGTRTELKNINSFRFVQKALEYEIKRQTKILEQGDKILQETRLWDETRNITFTMRSKEEAHDYRYFPEPDLTPTVIEENWIKEVQSSLPELPAQKRERFIKDYCIPEYDAIVLTSSKFLASYFEECTALSKNYKMISNWIMVELMRELKNSGKDIKSCPVTPGELVKMLELIEVGTINRKIAKSVFEEMFQTGKSAKIIVQEKGLAQITDNTAILKIIDVIIENNPSQTADYKAGKIKLMGFFVGLVMRETKGQADPSLVNKLLKEKLG